MYKRKLTRESLAELAKRMPVLSEEVQSTFIGGGDGSFNDPYTFEEYSKLHNPTQVFYLNDSGTICYDLPDIVVVGQSGGISGSVSGGVSGSVSGNVTNSNTGNGVYFPWGSLDGNNGDDGFQSWLYWGGGSNDSTNNGEGENGGNSVWGSVLGWSAFGMNAAGDLGDNADDILKDRGKYMTPGKIYKLKYHPITVRFAIGGIETTSQVLNVIRVGGQAFGLLGDALTLYDIYDEYTSGDKITAYWKTAFAAAEGVCVFIPGYGWAVSLGLGLAEQLIFD